MSSRQTTLRADTEAVRATVRLAQALAASGQGIDLAGLDDQIGRLCAGILDLPPDEGSRLRQDLLRLRQETTNLHATLDRLKPSPG